MPYSTVGHHDIPARVDCLKKISSFKDQWHQLALLKSKRGLQGFVIILNLSENKCTRQIKARTQTHITKMAHYKEG